MWVLTHRTQATERKFQLDLLVTSLLIVPKPAQVIELLCTKTGMSVKTLTSCWKRKETHS